MKNRLKRVAIIGGGRWARVLTTALCDVLCENACVTIHTYHGCCAMREWLHTQSFKPSVSVASGLPNFESESIELAVVVNAARDHEATIEKCLNAGVAVLSEKPVTVSYAATNRLIALAEDKNVSLSPAHVFLFANYLQKFSDILPDRRDIKSIQFEWEDPLVEARYGEAKTYDAGLPIYIDCLPHVLSIIDMLVPNMVHAVNDLKFRRGGADLIIESILGNIPCQIKLVRNGVCRKRLVTVMADKQYQVDFTTEPGHIAVNNCMLGINSEVVKSQRPLTCLFSAFQDYLLGEARDSRFDINLALRTSNFIEQVSKLYNKLFEEFLIVELRDNIIFSEALEYALKEVMQKNGPVEPDVAQSYIDNIKSIFCGNNADLWYKEFLANEDKLYFIKSIFCSKNATATQLIEK